MKKIILVVVTLFFAMLCTFFAGRYLNQVIQKNKLREEIDSIVELFELDHLEYEKIQEKLNHTVTKGDVQKVEKAAKAYFNDYLIFTTEMLDVLEDDRLFQLLTVENYREDGKEFISTKAYIEEAIHQLENLKKEYQELSSQEKMMSYIEKDSLDESYLSFYREEIIGNIDSTSQTAEDSLDEFIHLLEDSYQVIIFLSNHQDAWEVVDDHVQFSQKDLSDQYNQLLENIK